MKREHIVFLLLIPLGYLAAALRVTAIIHELCHTAAGWMVGNPGVPTSWTTTGYRSNPGGWELIAGYLGEVFVWLVLFKWSRGFGWGVAIYAILEWPFSLDRGMLRRTEYPITAESIYYTLVVVCIIAGIVGGVKHARKRRAARRSRVPERERRRLLLEKQQRIERIRQVRRAGWSK